VLTYYAAIQLAIPQWYTLQQATITLTLILQAKHWHTDQRSLLLQGTFMPIHNFNAFVFSS